MIITETIRVNGREFTHNYSDKSFYIRKIGTDEVYEDAYDLPEFGYTYEETERRVEVSGGSDSEIQDD